MFETGEYITGFSTGDVSQMVNIFTGSETHLYWNAWHTVKDMALTVTTGTAPDVLAAVCVIIVIGGFCLKVLLRKV